MKSKIRNALPVFFLVSSLLGKELPPDHLLRGMGSEVFSERESAQAELTEWSMKHPEAATPALLKLFESDDDPEVRKRAMIVLRALGEADYLSDGQGYIGIMMDEVMLEAGEDAKASMGIRVLGVMAGSPAEKADLRAEDMIIALDGVGWKGIGALTQFGEAIAAKKPLVDVKLTVRRAGVEPLEIKVKLGKRPIADLRAAGWDLRLFEERARERHFKEWLGKQKRQAE
jgi:hypothetical protein